MDSNSRASIPLGFGGMFAAAGGRVAHFYRNREEMLSVLGPYVAEGIRRGDNCLVTLAQAPGDALTQWLQAHQVENRESGKLNLVILPDAHGGTKDIRTQVDQVLGRSTGPRAFVRLAWDWGNTVIHNTSAPELLRFLSSYERLVVSMGQQRLALSQLDLTAFRGDVVLDVLRAHSLCIMGEIPLRCSPDSEGRIRPILRSTGH